MRDGGDKISTEVKGEVEIKIEELKKIKDGENIEEIKSKTEELSKAISKIGEALYKQNQASAGGAAGKGREAEYEDIKKDEGSPPPDQDKKN